MLYEIYQNKILKSARVLSKIVRMLPFIITCVAVISGVIITLLALRGTVIKTECPAEIEYGQAFKCEAKAFWSDVCYEYSADGGASWSEEIPRHAGNYQARAAGLTIFGNLRHGKAVDFTIAPKSISVSVVESMIMYGDSPSAVAETLAYSDYLECGEYVFENGAADATGNKDVAMTYDVKAALESIRILDVQGNDVTKDYVIEPIISEIAILKKPIQVTVDNATHVYDALPFSFNVYELTQGALLEGDVLLATFTAELTDVGTVANEPVFKIATEQGADRTVYYDIRSVFGTLTVEKRPLVVTSDSGEFEYSGKDYSSQGFTVDESTPIVDHHELVVTSESNFKDVGEYHNTQVYAVLDQTGAEKTANYSIFLQEGTVVIKPKHILLETESAEWEYDGQDHELYDFPEELLLENHTCDYDTVSIRNVGEKQNAFIINAILDEEGRDVTRNYAIDSDYGTLKVTPRPLSITSGSESWVYDGADHTNTNVQIDGLLESHVCDWTTDSIRNVGEIENRVNVTAITDKNGENVTANYDISYTLGTLSVTPRALKVFTGDGRWIYDGTYHELFDCTLTGLVDGHYVQGFDFAQIKNVGQVENVYRIEVYSDNEPTNGKATARQSTDVTANYEITYEYGMLEVQKRPVTIHSLSNSWIYDGEAHSFPEYVIESDLDLAEGEELVLWNWAELIDADHTENTFEFLIHDGQCRHENVDHDKIVEEYSCCDTTFNYDVKCIYDTIIVYPRPIRIKPVDEQKIYDDTPLVATEIELMEDSPYDLVNGHVIVADTIRGSITDVGVVESEIRGYRILDANSKPVTKNYLIEYMGVGTLTILPRPITVYTDSAEKYYDRLPLRDSGYGVYPDRTYDLVPGHRVYLNIVGSQTAIGESYNAVVPEETRILSSTRNVTHNYEITYEFGTLKVLPHAVIYVTSASDWKYYDGTPLRNPEYEVNVAQGAIREDWGHRLSVNVFGSIVEVGIVSNSMAVSMVSITGQNVADYYQIIPMEGTLEIREKTPPKPEVDKDFVFGRIMTEYNGVIYLKQNSYGDYNGTPLWETAPPYWDTLPGGLGYHYLTSYALEASGQAPSQAKLKDMVLYMLPYYMGFGGDYERQSSDTICQGVLQEFSVPYYSIPMMPNGYDSLKGYLGEYAAYEEQYREYVYQTYLTLDEETRSYMEGIIAEENFNASDARIIYSVAKYIQGAAVYDDEGYDRALDYEPNVAVAFLETYKCGKCTHYASAATLLYRALGIPARYVEGFMIQTKAGRYVEIKNPGHAWVEVYIDGLGWVQVEVTASKKDISVIEITPEYQWKYYDGQALIAESEIDGNRILVDLLKQGYTYEVQVSGSQTEIGKGVSTITDFVLYDPNMIDVTNQFKIVYREGVLHVVSPEKTVVRAYLYELQKRYDGTPLQYEASDYEMIDLPGGFDFYLDLDISLTEVSSITLAEINEKIDEFATYRVYQNGRDVTDQFVLIFDQYHDSDTYLPIRVDERFITVKSASQTKIDDGKPLENHKVTVSAGTLVEGHELIAEIAGYIDAPGTELNVIADVKIVDKAGNDVTQCYKITLDHGRLTILDPNG